MSFKVNLYDPNGQAYAPRIKHEDWERHRSIISHLHAAKTPRKVMLKQLRDDYDFTPTLGQLQAKCKEWNLKVYAKDVPGSRAAVDQPDSAQRSRVALSPAYYMASESGFVEEWSDDYRVHPSLTLPTPASSPTTSSAWQGSTSFADRSLPSEYIGGGLLANSADSHWPLPESDRQCETMLQAAHYYHAVSAFQQSFSIYRAVYLHQRRRLPICNVNVVTIALLCCCAAVTDHQRNIMHSVLNEIGSSQEIDSLSPLLIDCLQSASLNMICSDPACDIDSQDQLRARANAYMLILTRSHTGPHEFRSTLDLQALLYKFEHDLLMQEHETRLLQKLLTWCESATDRLHHEMDDIFVGYTICEGEYYRRLAQVLSGYLLSEWLRQPLDLDEHALQSAQRAANCTSPQPLQLQCSTTQILAALSFMVVDAIQCDPLAGPFGKPCADQANPWFLDAAKFFKRGARMLCRLDERSRCSLFADAFLERFYTSLSYRQRSYRWAAQMPAIVDSVGIYLAQQNSWTGKVENTESSTHPSAVEAGATVRHGGFELSLGPDEGLDQVPGMQTTPHDALLADVAASPMSECSSIASFVNTYRRTLKRKYDVKIDSGKSTPGDAMSLSSSAEFRFGIVTSGNSADTDSLWHVLLTNETCAILP